MGGIRFGGTFFAAAICTCLSCLAVQAVSLDVLSPSIRDGGFESWTMNGGNSPNEFWSLNENAGTTTDAASNPVLPGPLGPTEGSYFAFLRSSFDGSYNIGSAQGHIQMTDLIPPGPLPPYTDVTGIRLQFDWTATDGPFTAGNTYVNLVIGNTADFSQREEIKTTLGPGGAWDPATWKQFDATYDAPFMWDDGLGNLTPFDDILRFRLDFQARGSGDGSAGDQALYVDNVRLTLLFADPPTLAAPEPGSLGLLGLGLLFCHRKRRTIAS